MVILVTVSTSQIAPSHGNEVGEHRVTSRNERASDEAELPNLLVNEFRFSHYEDLKRRGIKAHYLKLMTKNNERGPQTQPVIAAPPYKWKGP